MCRNKFEKVDQKKMIERKMRSEKARKITEIGARSLVVCVSRGVGEQGEVAFVQNSFAKAITRAGAKKMEEKKGFLPRSRVSHRARPIRAITIPVWNWIELDDFIPTLGQYTPRNLRQVTYLWRQRAYKEHKIMNSTPSSTISSIFSCSLMKFSYCFKNYVMSA